MTFHICCLCRHPSPAVLVPTLQSLGNIVAGDDAQTQVNMLDLESRAEFKSHWLYACLLSIVRPWKIELDRASFHAQFKIYLCTTLFSSL